MRKAKRTARCCVVITNQRYRYCPYCAALLEWPPTRAQLRAQARRDKERAHKMATDKVYAALHREPIAYAAWDEKLKACTASSVFGFQLEGSAPAGATDLRRDKGGA